jgi:predicted short-subunit dehydrogenase-like oxidoreductase (DUF2520 family)
VAEKPAIAIVGTGRLGRTLAKQLTDSGYRIAELVSRPGSASKPRTRALARAIGARVANTSSATLDVDLIWLCVPDSQISASAAALRPRTMWKGKVVFHSSGALTSDELDVLRGAGASVAAVHPLMTFVNGSSPRLQGVSFAVEGDAAALHMARGVVKSLGGEFFRISKKHKATYHAFGAFTSPLLIALLASAEQVARTAGISAAVARRRMLPILQQTLANYSAQGPNAAFTGPIVRGDAEIVRKHLDALDAIPEVVGVYKALVRSALRYLPSKNRSAMQRLVEGKIGSRRRRHLQRKN